MISKRYQKECVIEFKGEWLEEDIEDVLNQIKEVDYFRPLYLYLILLSKFNYFTKKS